MNNNSGVHTATPKMTYGVSTVERSNDGFNVEIIDSRLNIGEGLRHRRACDINELREAADKLNAHDDLVKALQAMIKLSKDGHNGLYRPDYDAVHEEARAALAKAQS